MTKRMNVVVPWNYYVLSHFFCIQEQHYKEPDLLVMAIGQSSPEIKWDCRDMLQLEQTGTTDQSCCLASWSPWRKYGPTSSEAEWE